jgi:hypothetical protein
MINATKEKVKDRHYQEVINTINIDLALMMRWGCCNLHMETHANRYSSEQ